MSNTKLDELASAIMPGGQFKNEEINTMKNLEELWGKIGSVTKKEVVTAVLKDEIDVANSKRGSFPSFNILEFVERLNVRLKEIEKIKE